MRMLQRCKLLTLTVSVVALSSGCGKKEPSNAPAEDSKPRPVERSEFGAFGQLPKNFDSKSNKPSEAKLALGKMLYHEGRLSRSGKLSCNSCHKLTNFGVDGEPTSPGHAGARGDRNSPTTFNAAGHFRQFWDGREPDVEAQAKGPVLNPGEHGLKDAAEVEAILSAIPGYVVAFKKAFPESGDKAVTFDNFAKAVGAFERKLVTPSAWDRYLGGDDKAIGDAAKKGARLFVETGCVTCHNGPLLGGNTYQKLGKAHPWPRAEDEGRKKVTKKGEDLHMFKVPSLRNVEKTGPYFHDGKTASLAEAVKLMAHHQLDAKLTDTQVSDIVEFLKTLTGEVEAALIAPPQLPAGPAAAPAPTDAKADGPVKGPATRDVVPAAKPAKGDAPAPKPPAADKPAAK